MRGGNQKGLFKKAWWLIAICIVVYTLLNASSNEWIVSIATICSKILTITAIATVIGTLIENMNISKTLSVIISPLTRWGRLPEIVNPVILTSLFSLSAANISIQSMYREGQISRDELRITAIVNSFMALIYHSLRVSYPMIALLGIIGISYLGIVFISGIVAVFVALFLFRSVSPNRGHRSSLQVVDRVVLSRRDLWRRVIKRTKYITFRAVTISIPIVVLFSFISQQNIFESISWVEGSLLFSPEIIAIATAMGGGLYSSSAVAYELLAQGSVTNLQILMALLLGSVISSPIRVIRRSLPSAMGIFAAKDAFVIVGVYQGVRIAAMSIALLILILSI